MVVDAGGPFVCELITPWLSLRREQVQLLCPFEILVKNTCITKTGELSFGRLLVITYKAYGLHFFTGKTLVETLEPGTLFTPEGGFVVCVPKGSPIPLCHFAIYVLENEVLGLANPLFHR
jgi:hypothetical protein